MPDFNKLIWYPYLQFYLCLFFMKYFAQNYSSNKLIFKWISSGRFPGQLVHIYRSTNVSNVGCREFNISNYTLLLNRLYGCQDPHKPRFMSYLSLFTFAMLTLVTADNFLQLFFGWEGVGLCSYLIDWFLVQKTIS